LKPEEDEMKEKSLGTKLEHKLGKCRKRGKNTNRSKNWENVRKRKTTTCIKLEQKLEKWKKNPIIGTQIAKKVKREENTKLEQKLGKCRKGEDKYSERMVNRFCHLYKLIVTRIIETLKTVEVYGIREYVLYKTIN